MDLSYIYPFISHCTQCKINSKKAASKNQVFKNLRGYELLKECYYEYLRILVRNTKEILVRMGKNLNKNHYQNLGKNR